MYVLSCTPRSFLASCCRGGKFRPPYEPSLESKAQAGPPVSNECVYITHYCKINTDALIVLVALSAAGGAAAEQNKEGSRCRYDIIGNRAAKHTTGGKIESKAL